MTIAPIVSTYEALHPGPTSAEVVRDIFSLHFPNGGDVIDLTFGQGTFWKWWEWGESNIKLVGNDRNRWPVDDWFQNKYGMSIPYTDDADFTATGMVDNCYDIAVFDPPFTANGPSKEGHQKRYGADRSQDGAPQSIKDVHRLLRLGTLEACRIASEGVIVKTCDVVESGKYHDSEGVARDALREAGWRIIDTVRFLKGRRPQPDAQRGSKIKHFRNRPSVFLIARPA